MELNDSFPSGLSGRGPRPELRRSTSEGFHLMTQPSVGFCPDAMWVTFKKKITFFFFQGQMERWYLPSAY